MQLPLITCQLAATIQFPRLLPQCSTLFGRIQATKGGQVTHFTQFDIDFNQEKSLLETRCSGALTRVYSAIAIETDKTEASAEG